MTNYLKFPTWADSGHVHVVVETPRGSRAKLEFDPKLGAFTLAKPLLAGLTYPYDWGFIPSTKAEDGDPLDVLIIHDAATYPDLVLTCKPIGVLEVLQPSKGKKERNDRVFVVPDRSPFEGEMAFAGPPHPRNFSVFASRAFVASKNFSNSFIAREGSRRMSCRCRFLPIVEALARLRSRSCIIDGGAVAGDERGIHGRHPRQHASIHNRRPESGLWWTP